MNGEIKLKQDNFKIRMDKLLDKAKSAQGGFARVYSIYQKLQAERFQTENASQGDPWPSLNADYAAYKIKRYGGGAKRDGSNWKSWPGGGTKKLIGTGTLAGAVMGPGSPFPGVNHHKALFTSVSMQIKVDQSGNNAEGKPFIYPSLLVDRFSFMKFSDESFSKMKKEFMKYVLE